MIRGYRLNLIRTLLVLLVIVVLLSINASALDVTRSTILYSNNDTFAYEGDNAGVNYGSNNYMNYGYYSAFAWHQYAYVKFPYSISGSTGVVNSTFYLYEYANTLQGDVYRVTADWGESTLTWNNKPTYASPSIGFLPGGEVCNWCSLDITNTFKSWYNGSVPNYGLVIPYLGTTDYRNQAYTKESSNSPYLLVYYNITNAVPSVPITTQHLNYVNSSSTTILWSASTDGDSDPITYGVKVGTSSGATDVLNYNDTDTTSNSFTMTPQNSYYYSVRACDPYECSAWSAEKSFGFAITTPYTPTNGSALTKSYPPLTSDIAFTWSEIGGGLDYNLLVAKDANFNLIAVDTTTANNYSTQALDAGNYWWKVQYYNSTSLTYYNWSAVFNFTLSNTQTTSGTNIQGTVYELISGTITPISSATVYIYNTTWSSYMATGSNGYYLFTGLAADTYTLYATKADYETSPLSYVTPTANNTSTNNINMVRYVSPYITNFVYETILIQNIFGTPYVGSTVTLYEGDGVVPYKTATTDSTGQAVFYVIKDQKYRLTISGGGLSGTLTYWIYGKEETYPIIIVSGFPTGGNRDTDILTNLTVTDINATHKNLNLVYNDIIGSTSQIWFYATNISTGVTCTQSSTADSVTLSCAVLASGTYQFGFNATSTKYGYFKDNMVVNFNAGYPNTPTIETNVDHTLLQWASIIILVILASLFSVTTIKFGAVILPLSAMALWVFGWFEPAIGNPVLSLGLLSTALVLGVLIYMRMSEAKVVYQ